MALMMKMSPPLGVKRLLCTYSSSSSSSSSLPSQLVSVFLHSSKRGLGFRVSNNKKLETRKRIVVVRAAGAGNDEVDVSVFRFTLGIPGFDDADLPRLVGILFGSLLLVNHAVSIKSMTSAQLTSEALGLFLAAVAISLPSVGRRLKGGESAKEGLNKTPGRRTMFELAQSLSGKQKQELAWGSFALLQNTKTSAVIVWRHGEVVCARGNLDLGAMAGSGSSKVIPLLQKLLNDTPFINSSGLFYVSNGADTKGWSIVPKEAKSMLVQPFESSSDSRSSLAEKQGGLILFSYQPRSYSSKERTWIAMLAQKLFQALKT